MSELQPNDGIATIRFFALGGAKDGDDILFDVMTTPTVGCYQFVPRTKDVDVYLKLTSSHRSEICVLWAGKYNAATVVSVVSTWEFDEVDEATHHPTVQENTDGPAVLTAEPTRYLRAIADVQMSQITPSGARSKLVVESGELHNKQYNELYLRFGPSDFFQRNLLSV
tara:strand:+ start:135 stop:638 length:504 start_codon:yes stop_codon:yes gene_type:complete